MILLIDNYDSGSSALYRLLEDCGAEVRIVRNDEMPVWRIAELQPHGLILSTGAGLPKDTGCCMELVQQMGEKVPVLGLGLGAACIAEAFGATHKATDFPTDERTYNMGLDTSCSLFSGLNGILSCKENLTMTVQEQTLPECLYAIARDEYGRLIAFAHMEQSVFGVQVQPQSLQNDAGKTMIRNFLKLSNEIK